MLTSRIDIILTLLFGVGLAQVVWLSVMLLRKHIAPSVISAALPPLIAIWVILWPLYEHSIWLWAGIILLGIPIVMSYGTGFLFWQQLRIAWSGTVPASENGTLLPHLWFYVSLLTALAIAAAFFQRAPEFGLGIGLSICLAFPAAALLDRTEYFKLAFPLHPEQTLAGHLGLIIAISLICIWSIHIYHGIGWQRLLIATLIAGMAASAVRGFSATNMMLPASAMTIGTVLWLL